MTIIEICDLLRKELLNNGYEYGFILDGKKYKPDMSNGFDREYYRLSTTIYRVQPPSVTMKEKIGTCIETVLVMKSLLDEHNISNKIWMLYNKSKNKVHTILTFDAEGKVVYLELTPQSAKPWYGKEIIYSSEQEFLEEYSKNNYEVSDITDAIIVGEQPEFFLAKLNTPILETERMILRPLSVADANDIYERWTTDERVARSSKSCIRRSNAKMRV